MINYTVEQNVAVIRWHMTNSPMNVLNDESIPLFDAALEKAYADTSVIGVIITSDKPEFVAGADLKMILRNNEQPPAEMLNISTELNRIFRRVETSGKPTVAAINGTVLGGGYEICLACHHRIALRNAKTQIGLVEVTLGLLPGGGGTQRLPRMIGVQAALPLLLAGTKLDVPSALKQGLIDELADTPAALLDQARIWILANPKPVKPWDRLDPKTGRVVARDDFDVPGGNVQSPTGAQTFSTGTAMLMAQTKGNYPAPLAIMSCVYEGLQVNIDRGLQVEGRYFVQVARSKVARNMINTLFLGVNAVNKGANRPTNVPGRETASTDVKKIGIVGAGTMGAEIACMVARAGIDVVLNDASPEAAAQGKGYVHARLGKGVERGKLDAATAETLLNRITPTATAADLTGCDLILIIDAGIDQEDTNLAISRKDETYPVRMDPVRTYLTAVDSSILTVMVSDNSMVSITDLGKASANPAKFIGIHVNSPVDKTPLVEVIMGEKTSEDALAVTLDFARKLRKTPIVVNDSRGGYTSRCFSTYTAEGLELLCEGVRPGLIENAGKDAGMPVGPLAAHDEVSLGLSQTVTDESMKAGTLPAANPRHRLVQQLIRLGRTGKKAGAGFYDYPPAAAPTDRGSQLWPGLAELCPVAAQQPSLDEVKTRLLYRQALEAVRCLDENVIRTQLDGDVGSVLGWAFPTYTGGALTFVDFVGVGTFVNTCDRLADLYGERFRPTEQLRERAALAVTT